MHQEKNHSNKGTEVQQTKAQAFPSTPWVPFHQELLKIFTPYYSLQHLHYFFLK